MFKAVITTPQNKTVYLEYDKEKYDIEYVGSKNAIILRRLSDNTVLEIFNDKVGFIVQSNAFGETNFVVTDYSNIGKNGLEIIRLKHYITSNYVDELILKDEFDCNSVYLEQCRVADSSFIVEQDGYGGSIYNLNLNEKSRRFDRIYNDNEIKEIVGEKILMVSEEKYALVNSDIKDTITYGINPETFEIVTPIWSEMQQRYIKIYTREQVDKINEQLKKENKEINTENYSLGDITIYFEISKYLEIVAPYFNRTDRMYLDFMDSKVNQDFVKKFVK